MRRASWNAPIVSTKSRGCLLVEAIGAFQLARRFDARAREMFGRVQRRARDPGVQHGKTGKAERTRLGQKLAVDDVRRLSIQEVLRTCARCGVRSPRPQQGENDENASTKRPPCGRSARSGVIGTAGIRVRVSKVP